MPQAAQIDATILAQALLALAGQGAAYKAAPSTTPTTTYAHGNGGLLSAPGLSKDIINAMILPHMGVQSRIPSYPSNEQNPLYAILTGVTATTGSEPTGVCDDPPVAGLAKLCEQSYVFGRQSRMTRVFELDRMGLTTNRGEFYDFNLVGNPFTGAGPNEQIPTVPGGSAADRINSEVGKQMFELAVAWGRDFGPRIYTGNPTNNTAGGGDKYFRGFDALINTGYRDAETGVACAAADSIVANLASINVSTSGSTIVRQLTSIARRLKLNARNMGLNPVKWVIAMRETLFYELTEVWPCSYMTYRCQNVFSTSQVQQVATEALLQMRDEMRGNMDARTGQYLMVDGEKWEVVFDDFIAETALANGAFNSSIYFIPLTVVGGRVVTYQEYVNYDMSGGFMDGARAFAPDGSYFTTDGGRFAWHKKPPSNFCVQALVKSEPRLILRTPQIAARVTNVAYTPLAHERDWNTSGYYFVMAVRPTAWATGRRSSRRPARRARPTTESARQVRPHLGRCLPPICRAARLSWRCARGAQHVQHILQRRPGNHRTDGRHQADRGWTRGLHGGMGRGRRP